MVQPSGENRRYHATTHLKRYGGRLLIPECQKAKIDLEPGTGGFGDVSAWGSSSGATGGAITYGRGEVPGIIG